MAGVVSFLVTAHKGKGGSSQTRKEKGFFQLCVTFAKANPHATIQSPQGKPKLKTKGNSNMKAIIAIDSLKGSLSSLQAGDAIREGILRAYKDAVVQVRPLADGGEGTVEALTIGMGGELQTVTVTGPLGEKAGSPRSQTGF